jgi:hypothetical protein
MKEYQKKRQESTELAKRVEDLESSLASLDTLKNAKSKYKDMGKKMLATMKQMDTEMKELVAKLDAAQKELKEQQKVPMAPCPLARGLACGWI